MPESEIAALIGALSTLFVFLGGIYASRRFGLPGLARSVETEQARLIAAQKERIDLLEVKVSDLESCQSKLEDAEKRTQRLERQVSDLHAELAEIRKLGRSNEARLNSQQTRRPRG